MPLRTSNATGWELRTPMPWTRPVLWPTWASICIVRIDCPLTIWRWSSPNSTCVDDGTSFEFCFTFNLSNPNTKLINRIHNCRELVRYEGGRCNRGTAGFAYVGGACVVNKRLEKVNSVAIIEDSGGFSGIIVAAHEVGHLWVSVFSKSVEQV